MPFRVHRLVQDAGDEHRLAIVAIIDAVLAGRDAADALAEIQAWGTELRIVRQSSKYRIESPQIGFGRFRSMRGDTVVEDVVEIGISAAAERDACQTRPSRFRRSAMMSSIVRVPTPDASPSSIAVWRR